MYHARKTLAAMCHGASQSRTWPKAEPRKGPGVVLRWWALSEVLFFRPQGSRAMCFENISKFRNRIWRAFGARFDFEPFTLFEIITPLALYLYTHREGGNFEISKDCNDPNGVCERASSDLGLGFGLLILPKMSPFLSILCIVDVFSLYGDEITTPYDFSFRMVFFFLPSCCHGALDFFNQSTIKGETQWITRNLVFCVVCSHPVYSGRQICGRTSRGHTEQEEGHT